jgi:hypothetical protein
MGTSGFPRRGCTMWAHGSTTPRTARWLQRDPIDAAGFIPVIGDLADAASAIGYALEGDYANAAISAASALGGDVFKAGRLAKKVVQELVEEGAEQAAKREAKNALQEQGKKHANKTSGNNPHAQKGREVCSVAMISEPATHHPLAQRHQH